MLQIAEYYASECEDENVVIEESLRERLFDYIDVIVDQVFTQILQPFCVENASISLKTGLVKCFYQWMRLKLPENSIINLTQNRVILEHIFNLIKNESDDQVNESATDCII